MPIEEIDTTKLVIVSQYYELLDAHMAQEVLRSHGIENELEGELSNSLIRHRKAAIIPIRLWVREENAAEAAQILGHPASDPQIPPHEEPPLTGWSRIKRILIDVWQTLTLS